MSRLQSIVMELERLARTLPGLGADSLAEDEVIGLLREAATLGAFGDGRSDEILSAARCDTTTEAEREQRRYRVAWLAWRWARDHTKPPPAPPVLGRAVGSTLPLIVERLKGCVALQEHLDRFTSSIATPIYRAHYCAQQLGIAEMGDSNIEQKITGYLIAHHGYTYAEAQNITIDRLAAVLDGDVRRIRHDDDDDDDDAPTPRTPTDTELDALRSWLQARDDNPDLQSKSLKAVYTYIKREGVIVNGEPYDLPTFETWRKRRQRALRKAKAMDAGDNGDT